MIHFIAVIVKTTSPQGIKDFVDKVCVQYYGKCLLLTKTGNNNNNE